VSFAAFYISLQSPHDPVDKILSSFDGSSGFQKNNATLDAKDDLREKLGLNKPGFYFSIRTLADCDTLHKIKNKIHQDNLAHLTRKYGNWDEISDYYLALQTGLRKANLINPQEIFDVNSDFNSEEKIVDTNRLFLSNLNSALFIDSSYLTQLKPFHDSLWLQYHLDVILDNEYLSEMSFEELHEKSVLKDDSLFLKGPLKWHSIGTVWSLKDSLVHDYAFRPDSSISGTWSIDQLTNTRNGLVNAYNILLSTSFDETIEVQISTIDSIISNHPFVSEHQAAFNKVLKSYHKMTHDPSTWKNYVPSISVNGLNNQYHHWLFGTKSWFNSKDKGSLGLLRGDFGYSYSDGRSVKTELWRKFKMSFELVLISILLAYLISIPIGIYAAYKRGSWFDKGSALILFILYSMPNFFVGLLLINWFANPDNFEWFYASGSRPDGILDKAYYGQMSYWERLQMSWPYMVLPIATYTYASFAFISRVMRVGMLETLEQDYIRTARAKGLSERSVILKHALKNSLIPIITVFASVFPLAVGGSVIVEMIFNYPGMGWASLEAIQNGDYPIIIAVFCIAGFLTMFGYLVSDILYALVDPRISLDRKK
jgi:peptide/nickel transport system permease protein